MTASPSERLTQLLRAHDSTEDEAVRALTPEARSKFASLWQRRAQNELSTSRVFVQLDAELRLFGAPNEVLELSARAVDDEIFHAELCSWAAKVYRTTSEPLTRLPEPAQPSFPVCSPRLHRALFAALHSAVNETLAVTYLAACLAEAQSGVARSVVRTILSDEVRHSRIGWAVLGSPQLTTQDRASIAHFMPALLDICVSAWLADTERDYPDDLPVGHGCITHVAIAASVGDALRSVILPGLEHVGVDARAARSWVEQTQR